MSIKCGGVEASFQSHNSVCQRSECEEEPIAGQTRWKASFKKTLGQPDLERDVALRLMKQNKSRQGPFSV